MVSSIIEQRKSDQGGLSSSVIMQIEIYHGVLAKKGVVVVKY
jgi:hypothetical protein